MRLVGRIKERSDAAPASGLGTDPKTDDTVAAGPALRLVRPTETGVSDYRRWYVPGGTFFLTVVAYDRRPMLTTDAGRSFLRQAIEAVRRRHPFTLVATVLLPDHGHLVIQLPSGDHRYSLRMKQIKAEFSDHWLAAGHPEAEVTDSQCERGERGIWQPRFWEHTVRDEDDLERCADYIHWNPRKHGLVERVVDWPWSSFHRFVHLRHYDIRWGGVAPKCVEKGDWGEPT